MSLMQGVETIESPVEEQTISQGVRGIPSAESVETVERHAFKHLDQDKAKEVADWSRSLFEDIYDKGELGGTRGPFEAVRLVEEKIADLTCQTESWEGGRITPAYREGVGLFMERLIDFTKEKTSVTSSDGRTKLDNFRVAVQEALFSAHPSVATYIDLGKKIELTAEANRVPEAQGWFGGTMVGEIVYDLAFIRDQTYVGSIADGLRQKPIEDQLDIVHQLQTVGADAIANGDWAEPALHHVERIIKNMKQGSTSPLLQYGADLALDRLGYERTSPTLGVLKYHGDRVEGRLVERSLAELDRRYKGLRDKVKPDIDIQAARVYPIASDAVGFYDHSLLPRYFGEVHVNDLRGGKPVWVHAQSYEGLPKDAKLNPFAGSQDENLPLLLQHLHQPRFREKIEGDLGISLNQIPLRSQIHFLRFLAGQDREGFDRLRGVISKHPNISNKILGSFLAVAENVKHGKTVLQLAESLDERSADAIFSKYLEIAEETGRVRANLFERFHRQASEEQIEEIVQGLLSKGNGLLGELVKQVQESRGKVVNIAASGILEELGEVRSEVILFAATFKVAGAEYPISFEDVKDTKFQSKDSSELTSEEKEKMVRMFKANRADYQPQLQETTLAEFQEALSTPGKRFYLLTHQDELVSFIRFEGLSNGNLYAGSLNVRPEIKGLSLGSAMLQVTLEREGVAHTVEAIAFLNNPMLHNYIEKFGFVASGVDPNYKGSGETFLHLRRDEGERGHLKGPALTKEEILLAAIQGQEGQGFEVQQYDLSDAEKFKGDLQGRFRGGSVLSRFYLANKTTAYLVFEKAPVSAVTRS